ncbi:two-component system sensor kinase [Nocardia nova SH22a]|uniref:histidine kinase n=1 Tax=Nocardia nova SH22a TaxID=1415166 RepID=W5TQH8_9NOCA|nr:histidine kinase [Nocardia nova]AHH21374.1 two-component system sensor kinase [Nocardia nova SH22a]
MVGTALRAVPRADIVLGIVALLFAALYWAVAIADSLGHPVEYFTVAALCTGIAAAVFVRRTHVVPAFLITVVLFGAMAITAQLSPIYLSMPLTLIFAPISLMAVTEYARSWWWGPVALVVGIVGSLGSPAVRVENLRWLMGYHIVVLAVAYLWAARRRATRAAHEREVESARAAERGRIAAELHDVLGHTLAAVRAQSTAGLVIAERRGESTAEVLRTVSEISRDALGDIRHLVGLLRDGHAGEGTASADSFTDLRDTIRRARGTGIAAEEELPSDETLAEWQRAWPAATRLAVLRVVREAVTNVIKHAGPDAWMRVSVTRDSGACVVIVENTGVVPRDLGSGRGLAGLRERMSSVGGTLEVAATATGVLLAARIPTGTTEDQRRGTATDAEPRH